MFSVSQEALLDVAWPKRILSHPACETWILNGAVMFKGPRVKVGMATGGVRGKAPSIVSGRADYQGAAKRVQAHFVKERVILYTRGDSRA